MPARLPSGGGLEIPPFCGSVREARRTSSGDDRPEERSERSARGEGTGGLGFGAAVAEAWTVPLPRDVHEPFEVYVNGVLQERGPDYQIHGRTLRFSKPLAHEGRLGLVRWVSMFLGVAGTYRKHDSVDVVYEAGGKRRVASGLPIVPPSTTAE
jgi:hypothetical protein